MGVGKSKLGVAASKRNQNKIEDLEAGQGATGASFVLPQAEAPSPPASYDPIR
jgi:hypothetical protein